jgi:hypothetical protein
VPESIPLIERMEGRPREAARRSLLDRARRQGPREYAARLAELALAAARLPDLVAPAMSCSSSPTEALSWC